MPQMPHDEPKSQRSVLQILGEKTGLPAKVLLPDSDSEHGHSPVVDPGTPTAKLVPQGRGNYQLLGEIARGGMGVILKGHDTDLGRDVAVKVLDSELAKRPEVEARGSTSERPELGARSPTCEAAACSDRAGPADGIYAQVHRPGRGGSALASGPFPVWRSP